jgi:hypothetical protein
VVFQIYFSQLKSAKESVEQAVQGSLGSFRTDAARAMREQQKSFELQKEKVSKVY